MDERVIDRSRVESPIDTVAEETLRRAALGEQLSPKLRLLLLDALSREPGDWPRDPTAVVSDNAHAAARWIGARPEDRSEALVDLLEFTDALPFGARSEEIGLPEKVVAIDRALTEAGVPHAIGGAIALAYYAEPRATADIDVNVFVPTEGWPGVFDSLSPLDIDIETDLSALRRAGEAELGWDPNPVHLFFSLDNLHRAMREAIREVPFAGTTIPLVAPEHLVVRKVLLGRDKDWLDVEQILVAANPLDLAEIELWLENLAEAGYSKLERLRRVASELCLAQGS
ncbi:MAG TPA: hypothetical protein VMS11_02385 [Solirubrobacterales bacterium]|nr:hypothetical protein [Solirubrobacterales bacterium]